MDETEDGVKYVTGAIPGEEGKNSVAITVANERNTGSLSVEKIVEGTGAQPEKVFTFTLQLTHNDGVQLKGKYPTTITTVNDKGESTTVAGEPLSVGENGQATFTLKHGQTLTINGIPEGTAYTVTETVPTADGYQQTDANAAQSGTIGNGTTAAASFTNERNVYGLDVEKTLSGNGVDSLNALTEFAVTVKLAAPEGVTLVGEYTHAGGEPVAITGDANGEWSQTFILKDGAMAVSFAKLPEGTTYTVTEDDYSGDGYTTTVNGEEGRTVTAQLTGDAKVEIDNELNVGDLRVSKSVTGTGAQPEKDFTFTLTLEREDGVKVDHDAYEAEIATEGSQEVETFKLTRIAAGEYTFELKDGETITIKGIPTGTTYTVTETVPTADGYQQTDANAAQTGTITKATGESAPLESFTNHRDVYGLTVTKKTAGNGLAEPGVRKEFDITVTLAAPEGVTLVGAVDGTDLPAGGTVDPDGVWSKTFTLEADETVAFTGLPEGTTYTVSEANYTSEGFLTSIPQNTAAVQVPDDAQAAPVVEVTVTNTRYVGGLVIGKTVSGSGSSTADTFTFRLELENASANVDGEYELIYSNAPDAPVLLSIVDGQTEEITLSGGQTAFIDGIPVGTTYTVTELTVAGTDAETGVADENGYALTTPNAVSDTVESAGETHTVTFENERKVGGLTVTKRVEGNGKDAPNALTDFNITVTLTPPTGVALTGTWTQGETTGDAQTTNTFTLEDGESVTFTGLPAGTTYTVTEAPYAANGYETAFESTWVEEGVVQTQATASGTIIDRDIIAAANTTQSTTVTNTMNVGDLSVTKTVTGTGAETEREFEFTLTLTNEAGVTVDNTYTTSEGTLTVENGEATFTLKDGETLTIYGIPEGTAYTVTETVPAADGYAMTATGESGDIVAEKTAEAKFENHRDVGSLTITKEVEGNGEDAPNALTEFEVTVTLTAPEGVTLKGEWTQGEESGAAEATNTFILEDGESVEFTGLPEGTKYAVTEKSYAANGYESEIEPRRGRHHGRRAVRHRDQHHERRRPERHKDRDGHGRGDRTRVRVHPDADERSGRDGGQHLHDQRRHADR